MTAAELLAECHARRIDLQPHGGRLDIDAPEAELTPELLVRLRDCKAELLALLATPQDAGPPDQPGDAGPVDDLQAHGADGPQDADAAGWEIIDPPDPCPVCNGLELWQDAAGGWHCLTCSPPRRSGELLARVANIRRRHHKLATATKPTPWRLPSWPPVVPAEILADPVPECRDCGQPRVIPGQPGRPVGLCYPCWLKESARCENAPGTNAKATR